MISILIITTVVIIFILFFYRSPCPIMRQNNENSVYSPAFGKILSIKHRDKDIFVSIFLSPLDVHYQYYPVSGTITDIKYDRSGRYALAYELNKSNENEKAITTIKNSNGEFQIYQIAGMFVRRISSYGKINQSVSSGELLGIIHFGSRVDIIIPKDKFILTVSEGEYVKGFNTLLGYYKK